MTTTTDLFPPAIWPDPEEWRTFRCEFCGASFRKRWMTRFCDALRAGGGPKRRRA